MIGRSDVMTRREQLAEARRLQREALEFSLLRLRVETEVFNRLAAALGLSQLAEDEDEVGNGPGTEEALEWTSHCCVVLARRIAAQREYLAQLDEVLARIDAEVAHA